VHNAPRGAATPSELDIAPSTLSLEDVSARYPGADCDAVAGASLCVRSGEIVHLLGANGAGKSTLLRLAAGILAPASGRVRLCGEDMDRISARARARMVAFVGQAEPVPAGFRVREVVAMGRAPHQGAWMRETAADTAAIDSAMVAGELEHLAERKVDALSGGERRRVAIARALAQRPRALLLDEPAASLDLRHSLALHMGLARIAEQQQIACLVTMHDLDAASRFAARVALMHRGRVVAFDAPDEVMTPERIREVYGVEVDIAIHSPSGARTFIALT
jgi:iron complex transport system ATP-binding protein